MHECTNPWLECGEIDKAALEKIARCFGAIGKARRGVEVRLRHNLELMFRCQHGDALRCLRRRYFLLIVMDLVKDAATLRFG
jgi:hypothetical protein